MKKDRVRLVAILLLLALALTACGEKKPFAVEDTVKTLNTSAVFSETLEKLDRSVYTRYLGLKDADITEGTVYASTGATAEELAVLAFVDEAAAKTAEEALKAHVADQIEANTDYRPKDIPKLEKAVVERRGNTLLLVVAKDYAPVSKFLG